MVLCSLRHNLDTLMDGAMYPSDKNVPHQHRSVKSAHLDETFDEDLFFREGFSQSGLVHLRKKTIGETLLENTHPFIHGSYSFIHNGTVSHAEAYPTLTSHCKGGTDSERLFRRFLEIKATKGLITLDAYREMLLEVQNIQNTLR